MMKKYDTAGYGNPETIFWKRGVYGHLQKPAHFVHNSRVESKYAETTDCEMVSNILSDWNNRELKQRRRRRQLELQKKQ